MRTLNLHLPHLHLPRIGRPHFSGPHLVGGRRFKALHIRALGNIFALWLAAVLGVAMLVGLWMSANPNFRLSDILPH